MELTGLVPALFLVVAIALLEIIWGPDYHRTYSRLVARKRSSIMYYFAIFVIFLCLFSYYMVFYIAPILRLNGVFLGIYFVGAFAQLLCVSVPEVGGVKTKVHITAAGIMAASVLLQVLCITVFAGLAAPLWALSLASFLVMCTIVVMVATGHRLVRHEFLLQTIYFGLYLAVVVAVGYAR